MTLTRVENVTCDGENCEKQREKDSNHWLVGYSYASTIAIANRRGDIPGYSSFSDDYKDSIKDFCGEGCAIKWVSKQLTEIKR